MSARSLRKRKRVTAVAKPAIFRAIAQILAQEVPVVHHVVLGDIPAAADMVEVTKSAINVVKLDISLVTVPKPVERADTLEEVDIVAAMVAGVRAKHVILVADMVICLVTVPKVKSATTVSSS